MGAITATDSLLKRLAKRCSSDKWFGFSAAVLVYTAVFVLYTAITTLIVILDTGSLLGGDGVAQYYPFLLELRRNIIAFFESLANGSTQLTMIDLNMCYGTDTLTGTAMNFLPFLPVYALSALISEEAVPLFFAIVSLLLSYLSGLSFLCLCRHFRLHSLWSGFFASAYVFCGNYYFTGLLNPQFLYMYIAFPLMIIGMDRIISGKGWKLFVLAVFWLSLGGFTLIVYTIPFVVVFALIRVYFVHRDHYFKSLLKYFLRGCGAVILGVAMAGVSFLPFIMEYLQSTRAAVGSVDILSLLIPSMDYLTETISPSGENSPTGILLLLIPCFIYMLCVRGRKELRAYALVTLLLVALPVIRYGLNGFQYALCRWGFIPALVASFCCAAYMPLLLKSGRISRKKFLCVLAVYALAVTLKAAAIAVIFLIVMTLADSFDPTKRLMRRAGALIGRLTKKLRRNTQVLLAVCGALAFALFMLVIVIVKTKSYDLQPAFLLAAAVTVAIVLIVARREAIRAAMSAVLAAVLVLCGALQIPITAPEDYFINNNDAMLEYIASESNGDPFSRTMENISVYSSSDEEEEVTGQASSDEKYGQDPQINASLRYEFAAPAVFKSLINSDYSAFMRRCGMDAVSLPSTGEVARYYGKEVLYSLFGIDTLYMSELTDLYYGYTPTEQYDCDNGNTIQFYRNEYALPAGTAYDSFMSKAQYEALNPAELPYAMLDSVYAEGYEYSEAASQSDREYSVECSVEHTQQLRGESKLGIDICDNTVHISNDVKDHFLYLYFDGVKYETYDELINGHMIVDIDGIRSGTYYVHNQSSSWEWGYITDHYTFALGYCREDVDTLNFITPFEYDTMKVYAVPASVYTEGYEARTAETLHNIECSANTVTGDITVAGDRLLSVGLLYNDGWTAYVDGEEAPLYKANGLFLGIPLEAGSHTITLRYCTPWLLEGAVLSAAAVILFCVLAALTRRRRS